MCSWKIWTYLLYVIRLHCAFCVFFTHSFANVGCQLDDRRSFEIIYSSSFEYITDCSLLSMQAATDQANECEEGWLPCAPRGSGSHMQCSREQ